MTSSSLAASSRVTGLIRLPIPPVETGRCPEHTSSLGLALSGEVIGAERTDSRVSGSRVYERISRSRALHITREHGTWTGLSYLDSRIHGPARGPMYMASV